MIIINMQLIANRHGMCRCDLPPFLDSLIPREEIAPDLSMTRQYHIFASMEITLNNEPVTVEGDSISVNDLLELKRYTFRLRTVKVNGRFIDRNSYDREMIYDGDTVQVTYLMSGG